MNKPPSRKCRMQCPLSDRCLRYDANMSIHDPTISIGYQADEQYCPEQLLKPEKSDEDFQAQELKRIRDTYKNDPTIQNLVISGRPTDLMAVDEILALRGHIDKMIELVETTLELNTAELLNWLKKAKKIRR